MTSLERNRISELLCLVANMDVNKLFLVSYGEDCGGINVSEQFPELAVTIKYLLLARIREKL